MDGHEIRLAELEWKERSTFWAVAFLLLMTAIMPLLVFGFSLRLENRLKKLESASACVELTPVPDPKFANLPPVKAGGLVDE